ncbi:MAG: asparaginase [Pseudomonadota bacterium]
MNKQVIWLLGLGGTVSMTSDANASVRPTLGAQQIIDGISLSSDEIDLFAEDFLKLPSASLSLNDVISLAKRIDDLADEGASGIVVTQGTDTLEEVAFGLSLLLGQRIPVALSGAMRNPSQLGADGPANIAAALKWVTSSAAANTGVTVVMDDEVHAARHVQKMHTHRIRSFASPGPGPIGAIVEGTPHMWTTEKTASYRLPSLNDDVHAAPVLIVQVALGDTPVLLENAEALGYRGIVINGMGAGHVPSEWVPVIERVAARLPVILASRIHEGPVLSSTYGFSGSEKDLLERGVISAQDLNGLKARILLSFALATHDDKDDLRSTLQNVISSSGRSQVD